MRSVVVSACIAFVIVISSIFHDIHLTKVSEKLIAENERVMQSVKDDNYESAERILNEVTQCVSREEDIFAMMDNHEVLNNIKMDLWQFREFIQCHQKADALAKGRALEFMFEQLPENYKIKFNNIF